MTSLLTSGGFLSYGHIYSSFIEKGGVEVAAKNNSNKMVKRILSMRAHYNCF